MSISDQLGGAEQLILQLAKEDVSNVKVCFFKPKTSNIWEQSGVTTYYCDGSFFKFLKFCKSNTFNFVFSTHLMINALLGLLRTIGFLKTDKLIVRESTSVFLRYKGLKILKYKIAYFFGYRNQDLIVTQSDLMKDTLQENVPFLFKRTRIETVPNPFEYPDNEKVNESIDIEYDYIVTAGRYIKEKGFDILINSYKKILTDFPNCNLIILGEGDLREELTQQIIKEGLHNNVILYGFVDNVYAYFKNAKMCVVSSRIEGFPNVLLQMMSQNTKVVSTLCAGGIEKINGLYTCEVNDASALYNQMKKCLLANTTNNRKLFDKELNKRSVENFVRKIKT